MRQKRGRRTQGGLPEYRQTPQVVFQPRTYRGMQRGINKLVSAIRPTLGPLPRIVGIERTARSNTSPELLDNGGIIARRVIDLPDPDENFGAMFLRGALWNLYEEVGDGTATSAVLFQSIYNQGLRYMMAGGNPMLLRKYLEVGMSAVLEQLTRMVVPVQGKEMIARVTRSVCYDPELAECMAEVYYIIGGYGLLEIRSGRGREVKREYIEGSYWPGGVLSKEMITDPFTQRVRLEDAAILITDLAIEEAQEFVPVLRAVEPAGISRLVVVATKLSDGVLGVINAGQKSGRLQIIAVHTPGVSATDQMTGMEDLAVLSGGKRFIKAAGQTLAEIQPEDFGYARRIWADKEYLGLVGGRGDPRGRREQIDRLINALEFADTEESKKKLRARIGRLLSGAAAVEVGGMTETELKTRKELAERTADTLRAAVKGGVVPGGGVALLGCRKVLESMVAEASEEEEKTAYRILLRAVEVPFRVLLENSGHPSGSILDAIDLAGDGYGFDVMTGQVTDMLSAGILDVAAVQREAVFSAVSSAALALTIDTLIHRKKPPVVTNPD
jgi:chaperonin GroEL